MSDEPNRLYILAVSTWEGSSLSARAYISIIGIFSDVKLLAKAARNFRRSSKSYIEETLYVTQVDENEKYDATIDLIRFKWDEFKEVPEIKDILRRG
jgi:hypothetical protein